MPALSVNSIAITGGQANFVNSNGITFGMNGSSLTVSHNGISAGAAISAAGASQNAGTIVFSNSNGVSFGMNGSTITANTGVSRYRMNFPDDEQFENGRVCNWAATTAGLTTGAVTNTTGSNTLMVWPRGVDYPLSAQSIWAPISFGTFAATITATATVQGAVGLYSLTGTTMTVVSSEQFNLSMRQSSVSVSWTYWFGTTSTANSLSASGTGQTAAYSNIAGLRWWSASGGFAGTLPPGQYFWVTGGLVQTSGGNPSLNLYIMARGGAGNGSSASRFGAAAAESAGVWHGTFSRNTFSDTVRFANVLPVSFGTSAIVGYTNWYVPHVQLRASS